MKTPTTLVIALATAAMGAAAGHWWAARARDAATTAAAPHGVQAAVPAASATGLAASAPRTRKLLYYRNPMGLPDTSPTPKKDSMGMDYIPVYDDEIEAEAAPAQGGPGTVRISPEKVQKLGVRTEPAALRTLGRPVRASGRVEPDERRITMITPKFEGYVERLHVNVSGQAVARGQPLFEAYSPELVAAQREYAIAVQGVRTLAAAGGEAASGMRQLADASLQRLRNWDMPQDQIDALASTGEVRRSVTFRSPAAGIVTEKKAVQGMRFMPGETLYQVTDLGAVWVIADVFEQDIGQVRTGTRASVSINAYPGKAFSGTITYVYPTMNAATRTVPVRIELANPGALLKPAMFAQVEWTLGAGAPVLTVPTSAVIDGGVRRIVLVQRAEGRFEPREVRLGQRSDSHVQVLDGVREGELVVVSANFLIDAESNLQAAIGGLAAPGGAAAPAAPSAPAR